MIYRLINPKTGERFTVATLADMINRWACDMDLVMTDAGLPPAERQTVTNLYILRDQLRASQRDSRVAHSIAEMRGDQIRRLTSVEGEVL